MENPTDRTKRILDKIPYITIASITPEGRAWNSPVFAVHDENYNFYWNSSNLSQHSKNITSNKNIFIVVYDSNVSEGQGEGVYIEAEAHELTIEEIGRGLDVFYKGNNKKQKELFLPPNSQRLYIACPKSVWINEYDKNQVPPDWKVEVSLLSSKNI